jgi:rubrerythrin
MPTSPAFGSFEEILDFAIARERQAQEMYMAYSRTTDRKSFAQLLATMADMEKEHARLLAELKGQRDGAPALAGAARFTVEEPFKEMVFSPDMDYGDFLVLVIQKETEAERLYLRLEGRAATAEARRLFRHLAGEEKKHRDWAQEAYDRDVRRDN